VKAPDTSTEEPTVAPPTPEAIPAFRSVGFALSTIGYAVSHRFRSILAPLGLEPREFALLRAIGAGEGQSQQEAGERLQIPASRMVAFVDGLEARGLAERRVEPHDRRTRALYLTDAGRELLERAFALAAAYEQELCAGMSDEQREQLLELIWRVAGQLGLPEGVHAAHQAMADQADEEHCS
jgi:DNA-binding MarR family transcriptional regulator